MGTEIPGESVLFRAASGLNEMKGQVGFKVKGLLLHVVEQDVAMG